MHLKYDYLKNLYIIKITYKYSYIYIYIYIYMEYGMCLVKLDDSF